MSPSGVLWDELLDGARARLEWTWEHFGPQVAVCWTGGKDSTVVLHLWRSVLARCAPQVRPVALSIDTGWKFPQIVEFRSHLARQWNVENVVVAPARCSVPVAEDPVACCHARKVVPLQEAVARMGLCAVLVGVRADEHPLRSRHWHWAAAGHQRIAPILEWTEAHVWTYHAWAQIPWCSLYDQGYRSLGCVPCTRPSQDGAERAGRDPRKEAAMGALQSLGYF